MIGGGYPLWWGSRWHGARWRWSEDLSAISARLGLRPRKTSIYNNVVILLEGAATAEMSRCEGRRDIGNRGHGWAFQKHATFFAIPVHIAGNVLAFRDARFCGFRMETLLYVSPKDGVAVSWSRMSIRPAPSVYISSHEWVRGDAFFRITGRAGDPRGRLFHLTEDCLNHTPTQYD